MDSFPDFEQLPDEIKYKIWTSDPLNMHQGMLTSVNNLNLVANQICKSKNSSKELRSFIEEEHPRVVGFYWGKTDRAHITLFIADLISQNYFPIEYDLRLFDERNMLEVFNSEFTNSNQRFEYFSSRALDISIDNAAIDNMVELYELGYNVDLNSIYQIVKRRLICNKMNPDYAKRFVSNEFLAMTNEAMTNEAALLNGVDMYNLLYYLLVQTYAFNISGPFDVKGGLKLDSKLNSIDPNEDKWIRIINKELIQKIRTRLNEL